MGNERPEGPADARNRVGLTWNPSSPISARTLILAAENRMEKIHNALIVCSPPGLYKTAETLLPEDIEIIVNDHIKSWYFVIRELSIYFKRQGQGSLSLIVQGINERSTQTDLLGPPAVSCFESFAESILGTARAEESYSIFGFRGIEAGSEGAAAPWIWKIIDREHKKDSGKWHSFPKIKWLR